MRFIFLVLSFCMTVWSVCAVDGSRLWLPSRPESGGSTLEIARAETVGIPGAVVGTASSRELRGYFSREELRSLGTDDYIVRAVAGRIVVCGGSETGALYGAYHLQRLHQTGTLPAAIDIRHSPAYDLRLLNHWDNLDGTVERGYAGRSLWKWDELPAVSPRYREYARANASIGINGAVLNNVNATPKILTEEYLSKVKVLADIFRPYGIKVYLSVNFSSPKALGATTDSDPLNPAVKKWWQAKVREIYTLIPDFGGFLVKANSEGQPGPQDYGRTHADGANMLAESLEPYGGIVMWRAFVYAPDSGDRAKQACDEFLLLDGLFHENVIVQVKNGPIDFQPREPFTPLFGAMRRTPLMIEFQITQEYLGFSNHLAYLAPLFTECLDSDTYCNAEGSTVACVTDGTIYPAPRTAIAGVANIGQDANWTGHHFAQANWYAFGRLAWDHTLTPEQIADEWLRLTFSREEAFVEPVKWIMLESREAVVDYMMPLGLHHLFAEGHHYGPQPWLDRAGRSDWTSTYYHNASPDGIGFDRSTTGSNAVSQYFSPLKETFGDPALCPDKYLLWFHHLPWDYRMHNGETLWNNLCYRYDAGVQKIREFQTVWEQAKRYVDPERFDHVQYRLKIQARDAVWWKDACLLYFQTFSNRPIPYDMDQPVHDLEELKQIRLNLKHHN